MNKRATNHLRAFGLYRRRFFFFFSFGILFTGEPKPWRSKYHFYGVFQNVAAYKKAWFVYSLRNYGKIKQIWFIYSVNRRKSSCLSFTMSLFEVIIFKLFFKFVWECFTLRYWFRKTTVNPLITKANKCCWTADHKRLTKNSGSNPNIIMWQVSVVPNRPALWLSYLKP